MLHTSTLVFRQVADRIQDSYASAVRAILIAVRKENRAAFLRGTRENLPMLKAYSTAFGRSACQTILTPNKGAAREQLPRLSRSAVSGFFMLSFPLHRCRRRLSVSLGRSAKPPCRTGR